MIFKVLFVREYFPIKISYINNVRKEVYSFRNFQEKISETIRIKFYTDLRF